MNVESCRNIFVCALVEVDNLIDANIGRRGVVAAVPDETAISDRDPGSAPARFGGGWGMVLNVAHGDGVHIFTGFEANR